MKMQCHNQVKKRLLKDKEVHAAYARLALKYDLIGTMIEVRNKRGLT